MNGRLLRKRPKLRRSLELPDKADLRLETDAELFFDGVLGDRDQLPHIPRCSSAQVHHDVGVDVGYLRIPMAMAFQATLIDQPASSHSFDLLEDRTCARVKLEPRMARTAPAQVFLHDAMHDAGVFALELEGHRESDVTAVMQNARVIPELHVIPVDSLPVTVCRKNVAGMKNVCDEHRALPLGLVLEEMEILPHRAADRAGNSNVMLDARPSSLDRFGDDVGHHRAALHPQASCIRKSEMTRMVPDDQPSETLVSNKDVGAQPEDEVRNMQLPRGHHGNREVLSSDRRIKKICWTADAERGVWSKHLVTREL